MKEEVSLKLFVVCDLLSSFFYSSIYCWNSVLGNISEIVS